MNQYKDLLKSIISNGEWKEAARNNMPRTKSLFGTKMEFDMEDGFPLVTGKKTYFKGIKTELLWFLRGGTNIKYLVDNGCNIWNQDAYRWYLKQCESWYSSTGLLCDHNKNPLSLDRFIEIIKGAGINFDKKELQITQNYTLGDLGKVYGHQWRFQNYQVDQVDDVIKNIKENPYSRYHIINAWNKPDFNDMALPPCHVLYQFNCRKLEDYQRKLFLSKKEGWEGQEYMVDEDPSGEIMDICDEENIPKYYLDLQMYQRSCDTFLGAPFNIASCGLLLEIIAKVTNTVPSKLTWVGGDTHIYENHIPQVKEYLDRDTFTLPSIEINKNLNCIGDIELLDIDDISLKDYISGNPIKAELKTGL